MVQKKDELGVPATFLEGILIFSKAQKIVGQIMSADELASLQEVFQTLQPDTTQRKASRVLQYLWRFTASDSDFLGLYYTSTESVKSKFLLATLFETMHMFHMYCFEMKMIVCNGMSLNLWQPLRF